MSRSRKKTPIRNMCGGEKRSAMKKWKTTVNRKLRRTPADKDRDLSNKGRERFGSLWDAPSDGKTYFGEMKDEDDNKKYYDKGMRK